MMRTQRSVELTERTDFALVHPRGERLPSRSVERPRRVLLIDDQPMVSEALAGYLATQPDLLVIGQVRLGVEALAAVTARRPDLVLLGIGDRADDLDLVSSLLERSPDLLVAVLSDDIDDPDPERVSEAVRRGIAAWVSKSESAERLLGILRDLQPGDCYLPPRLLGRAVRALLRASRAGLVSGPLAVLTPREREVLQHMVDGAGRDEIAGRLYLSPNTVRTHTQNVLAKLDVHSVVEAVAVGLRCGLRPAAGG